MLLNEDFNEGFSYVFFPNQFSSGHLPWELIYRSEKIHFIFLIFFSRDFQIIYITYIHFTNFLRCWFIHDPILVQESLALALTIFNMLFKEFPAPHSYVFGKATP